MNLQQVAVNTCGRTVVVPAVEVDGVMVIATGRLPRVASVNDESWVEKGIPEDATRFVGKVAESGLRADIVTFAQHIYEATPLHPYYFEWDNVAAVDTRSFSDWWDRLPQATRKNCRRSARRGALTQVVTLDERLARGIKGIYDETPIRQGRRFWHYGKDVATVWRENGTYLDRSDFIATYYNDELIGFVKIVYVGRVARIMQILARVSHDDKRPTNALIAKAVELCGEKGIAALIYSKFQYGNKINTPLMEFKTRNGFERMEFPRYYVPLTAQGRVALRCRLHRGALGILPPRVIQEALRVRDFVNGLMSDQGNFRIHRRASDADGSMRDAT